MNQKLVITKCLDCGKEWKEQYTWHGQTEICKECSNERTLRNNCKRHGGKDGKDCYPCKLEGCF